MGRVSVVITTVKGEEKYLTSCLSSVKNFADEIVLVDMSKEAHISLIAKKYKGIKIFKHELIKYVEPVRNFGISKSSGDWVLILDPDEEVANSLVKRLQKVIENKEADYVRIPRKNIIFGKWIKDSGWWPDFNIRFFKKGKVSWNEIIHAVPITIGTGLDLEVNEDLALIHHHYESIDQFLEKMFRYTSIQAKLAFERKEKFVWKNLILKPLSEFLNRYYAQKGYKGAVHSLCLCLLQAASELIKEIKLWQLYKFVDQEKSIKEGIEVIRESQSELNFWVADTLVKEGGGFISCLRRKLRL